MTSLSSSKNSVSVIFVDAETIRNCNTCRPAFSNIFGIPAIWWDEFCHKANGYFGFKEVAPSPSPWDEGVATWCRFKVKRMKDADIATEDAKNGMDDTKDYYWGKLNVFSRWYKLANRTAVLVFNPNKLHTRHGHDPQALLDFMSCLTDDIQDGELADPFWIYPRLVGVVIRIQDEAVWAIRDRVRYAECTRPSYDSNVHDPRVLSFPKLYEVQRHATHVSETLEVAATTVEWMEKNHRNFLQEQNSPGSMASRNITSQLLFLHHLLLSLLRRSDSNKARLDSEIGLAFNTVTQRDSRTSVDISMAAQRDSAAMRTIALVSLLFLPSTFVSALFSTTFFKFDDNSGVWSVSQMFWLYWVVAGSLTVAAVTIWRWETLARWITGRRKKKNEALTEP
ncbi:Mg2+ transporter protein, CorA-like/Zinc transport protein ZntB, partial [Metarhizium hybridum]